VTAAAVRRTHAPFKFLDAVVILLLTAHPDDADIMAGGTVARWIDEGHNAHAAIWHARRMMRERLVHTSTPVWTIESRSSGKVGRELLIHTSRLGRPIDGWWAVKQKVGRKPGSGGGWHLVLGCLSNRGDASTPRALSP
jgi:hypothetical protein